MRIFASGKISLKHNMKRKVDSYVAPQAEIVPLVLADVVCGTQYSVSYGDSGKSGVFDDENVYDGGSF